MTSRRCYLVSGLLLCWSCALAARSAELIDLRQLLARLDSASSFRFSLSYRVSAGLGIAASFQGWRRRPDTEVWAGTWNNQGVSSRVAMVASGSKQYTKGDDGQWLLTQRGVETRILDQVQAVLLDTMASLLRPGVYGFAARMPLFDAAAAGRYQGEIRIGRNGMPVAITVREMDGRSGWECRFSRFGWPVRIRLPFVPAQTIRIQPETRHCCCVVQQARRRLIARFRSIGVDIRLAAGGRVLVDQALPVSLLGLLVGRGRVELWSAVRTEDTTAQPVASDVARRVRLRHRLLANRLLLAQPDTSLPLFPTLTCAILPDSVSSMVALVVDGQVLDAREVGPYQDKVQFTELGSSALVVAIAAMAQAAPLPFGFGIVEVSDGR